MRDSSVIALFDLLEEVLADQGVGERAHRKAEALMKELDVEMAMAILRKRQEAT